MTSSSSSSSTSFEKSVLTVAEAALAVRNGQIVHINGYENSHGEVANVWVAFNVNYERSKKRFLRKLAEFEAKVHDGKLTHLALPLFYNWVGPDGFKSALKGKLEDGRKLEAQKGVKADKDEILVAIAVIRDSLTAPKKITNSYDKISDSIFTRTDEDGIERLYLRNVLLVEKAIIADGEYVTESGNPSASAKETVLKDLIKKMLCINQYRTYILEANRFKFLTLAGEVLESESFSSEES